MQRAIGAMGHLTLRVMEGYSTISIYKNLEFVNAGLCRPPALRTLPVREEDFINPVYVWSDHQEKSYKDLQDLLTEIRVEVADHLASVSRIAASSFTKVQDNRHEKPMPGETTP